MQADARGEGDGCVAIALSAPAHVQPTAAAASPPASSSSRPTARALPSTAQLQDAPLLLRDGFRVQV